MDGKCCRASSAGCRFIVARAPHPAAISEAATTVSEPAATIPRPSTAWYVDPDTRGKLLVPRRRLRRRVHDPARYRL